MPVSSGKEWRGRVESTAKVLVSMRILALVVARGGSKRIPGKNIRLLGGKPLISWSIDVPTGIPGICDILVSTDSEEIAKTARNADAMIPWFRPQNWLRTRLHR